MSVLDECVGVMGVVSECVCDVCECVGTVSVVCGCDRDVSCEL